MRVRHFGNTANNAFHNLLLLKQYEDIESVPPISMFGLGHAMSAPAWEVVEFEVPNAGWVAQPDWAHSPECVDVNSRFSDIPTPVIGGGNEAGEAREGIASVLRRLAVEPMRGRRWADPVFRLRDRQILARRAPLPENPGEINIVYGADSLAHTRLPASSRATVSLEHGTLRWLADGGAAAGVLRGEYRRQLERSQHVWVTNLDPRTVEIAEDVVPGRWSALPHPFVPDPRVPFGGSDENRVALLEKTKSQALILLPSSQNWSASHDKGSIKALSAFVELRRQGFPVGLVAVEWGLQLAESKEFLRSAGLEGNVVWVAPMARLPLQKLMADVDVVWDQFGLDAFGALALRTVEQGTPFISRGLQQIGEQLIGGPVPWRTASDSEGIVGETTAVLEEMSSRGRRETIEATRRASREWLLTRHSPAITAALQRAAYERVLGRGGDTEPLRPDSWARVLENGSV